MKPVEKARAMHTTAVIQDTVGASSPTDIVNQIDQDLPEKDLDYLSHLLPDARRGRRPFKKGCKLIAPIFKREPKVKKMIEDAYTNGPCDMWLAMEGQGLKSPVPQSEVVLNLTRAVDVLISMMRAQSAMPMVSMSLQKPRLWNIFETNNEPEKLLVAAINDLNILNIDYIWGIEPSKFILLVWEQAWQIAKENHPNYWRFGLIQLEVMMFNKDNYTQAEKEIRNIGLGIDDKLRNLICESAKKWRVVKIASGKPRGVVAENIDAIKEMRRRKMTCEEIGDVFNVSKQLISKGIKKYK